MYCWCIAVESNVYRPIVQDSGPGVAGAAVELDLLRVGSEPVGMRCPYCQEDMMTRAVYTNTTRTHIFAIILGFFFWWLCCCILPYMMRSCKNVHHYCPHCRQFLGVYSRSFIV